MTQLNHEPNVNEPTTNPLNDKVNELWSFSTNQLHSIALLHAIGYGLIIFSILDAFSLLLPPELMNPLWEMQTIGSLVELTPVPFLGLGMLFFGGKKVRKRWELPLLKGISWLSLIVGILFFIMIPLILLNTFRLEQRSTQQITENLEQQRSRIEQIQSQLEQANTPEAMREFISGFDAAGRSPNIDNEEQALALRERIAESMENANSGVAAQAAKAQRERRIELLKNSVKWNLGALVAGVLFIMTWQLTRWARR